MSTFMIKALNQKMLVPIHFTLDLDSVYKNMTTPKMLEDETAANK